MRNGCCCSCEDCGDVADIKEIVKRTYAQAAKKAISGRASCCGVSPCGVSGKDPITRDLYAENELQNIPKEALHASLGCANPVALAELKPGEVVLDLGSGGGLDVLLSAKRVGPTGKAYGLDMTDEMLELARENQGKAGIENAEFLKGEIENIPLPDCSVDVVISNCVINLSTDKERVIREAYRVLKPGGRFAVADIVLKKAIPAKIAGNLSLWTGCIAGALEIDTYKQKLRDAGFTHSEVEIVREYDKDDVKEIAPDEIINALSEQEITQLAESFVSAFVRAKKRN